MPFRRFKGVIYAESALLSTDVFQKVGINIEFDNPWDEAKTLLFFKAFQATQAETQIGAVVSMLSGFVSKGASAIATGAIKAAVGAVGGTAKIAANVGSLATANVFVLDAEYDLKTKTIAGGVSTCQAIDINMAIPGPPANAGVGGMSIFIIFLQHTRKLPTPFGVLHV